ncbi:MAG: Ppx/GppA family phosphatase [Actinomycetota bacterium]|nr:Ppx/GppA family phosphatase [Nocardioidaceae bacterium]MDQ3591698.1 Ppx/GppA family phosphatase [Actinomycetota bacterium]
MRTGVLDIGSNTGHLLVVDAHRGAAPLPAYSFKLPLRLAEHLDADGAVDKSGIQALLAFVEQAQQVADDKGCTSVLAFATSAVRDASNADEVLAQVRKHTGVDLEVLPGGDEARLTFLAVRRWFGWSAGRLAVFDIGGGSLEIAAGRSETPDVAHSLPLGAGRLSREHLDKQPVPQSTAKDLRRYVRRQIAHDAGDVLRWGEADKAVATSKTFRSLARICGAAASSEGPYVRRALSREVLRDKLPHLIAMPVSKIAQLQGVSANRAHQIVAGAFVADAVMELFDLPELSICPWALREGVILERLDVM